MGYRDTGIQGYMGYGDKGIHALGYMDIRGIQGYEDTVHHEDRGYMDMCMVQSYMVQVGVWGTCICIWLQRFQASSYSDFITLRGTQG